MSKKKVIQFDTLTIEQDHVGEYVLSIGVHDEDYNNITMKFRAVDYQCTTGQERSKKANAEYKATGKMEQMGIGEVR